MSMGFGLRSAVESGRVYVCGILCRRVVSRDLAGAGMRVQRETRNTRNMHDS